MQPIASKFGLRPLLVIAWLPTGCHDYEVACDLEQTTAEVVSEADPIWSGTDTTWNDVVSVLQGGWTGTYSYNCDVVPCATSGQGGDWTGNWAPEEFSSLTVSGPKDASVTEWCRAYVTVEAPITISGGDTDFSGSGSGSVTAEFEPLAVFLGVSLDDGFTAGAESPLAGTDSSLRFYATFLAASPATSACAENGGANISAAGTTKYPVSGTFQSAACPD